ncbi:ABC transporter ATP-binding protein [Rhodovulum sulfidophilum]|uniref:ABC transporter ATP-binding protein n=1 Tax=Rhodovulum sulfidophilum TaxID=35806 RepID=UPI00192908A9|nr:ABC transporter ATP-binding protein [Rhodovulum sulfidophilum]MBL3587232.1 ABC transporter ATP-binding protein [Rhodovulum sulfidophilum]
MMRMFLKLLGDDVKIFRRYAAMALASGALNTITIALTVPVLLRLLQGDAAAALPWLAALLTGALACLILRRQVEQAGIKVGIAVLEGVRLRLGNHVARLPIGWFDSAATGRLNHALTQGVMEVAQLPAHVFTPVLTGLVVPPGLALVLFWLEPRIGLIALAALPLMVAVFALAARLGRGADRGYHAAAARTGERAVEFARTQAVLRAFSGDGASARFLMDAFAGQRQAVRRLIRLSTASVVLNGWALQAVFAAMLLVALRLLDADLTPAQGLSLVVALVLAQRFIEPMTELAGYGEALRGARNHLAALTEIAEARPLPRAEHPQPPRDSSVALEDVTFRYSPDTAPVLEGLSLRVAPGSMTALVGASGSGKSTVVRLVARFFDVERGRVSISGVDVRDMSEEVLSAQISQIFQDTYLLEGTIAENIRMGRPDAGAEEIAEAARLAGVDDIVRRLPQGLDSPTGEGGVRLSGGERQRIAIARALLKDAPILLVDEATAALDAENRALVTETLARLRGKRTLIVIAHQLSTIRMADRIAVLEAGRIVEQGPPEALAQRGGPYARLLRLREAAQAWRMDSPE